RPKRETVWASLTVLAATIGLTTVAFELPLPRLVRPEWVVSRPVDLLSAVVLSFALAGFLWEYHRRRDMLTWWIALSITVNMVGQFAMSFSRSFYDPLFDLAHVYKVIGYLIPLLGFSLYQIALLTERQKAEAALRLDESRLETLLRLNQMTEASLKELTDFTLEEAVRLTKSEIGYLAFMNEDETVLTMHSWSKTAMQQCAIIDKPIIYPVATTGLWGEAVRQRRAVITNDYAAPNPLKKGYPEGHVHVRRHMNIPVFEGKRIVAVSGVGNKEAPYDESDVQQLTLLMQGMWRLIQRQQAQEDVRRRNALLNALNEVLQSALTCETEADVAQICLAVAVELTKSEFGFVGEVNPAGRHDCLALSNPGWAACQMPESQASRLLKDMEIRGLWGRVIKDGKSLLVNDPASHPDRVGTPEGHPPITAYLGVPLKQAGTTIGIISLANKKGGYGPADQEAVETLGVAFAETLARKRADVQLKRHRDHLEELVTERAAELRKTNEQLLGEVAGRRRAVEEMQQAEQKYRTLLRSTDEGIFGVDREMRCTFINRAGAETLGYLADEVIGRNMHDLIHHTRADGRPYPAEECPVSGVLRSAQNCRVDNEVFWRRDGTSFPVELSANPITDAAGAVAGAVVAFTDITQRREAERQLKEASLALERSNKELEQFAYVASHDLQEPLRMVASYVQLLARRYQNKLDADADEFIGYAVEGARRMQALISDLLAYSRVGTQAKPFAPTPCETILQRALDNLQVAITESGATITHDPLPIVTGDTTQLTQLFQNLLGNALKFRRAGEAPRVHVGVERRDTECLLSVRDNGIGIDMQFAERIFQIFQRLRARDEYPGTGIGLAVCKKIVERHGGRIWVESAPGEGSTFFFTLPAEPNPT
ncbi:MAG: PAS domain S-box protein, partial [Verrucomicrobia bacterium]|nr:PAS domain S-box protein [Verrucomicrobiota bacterium]